MQEIDEIYHDLCLKLIHGNKVGNTHELNNVQVTLNDITQNIVSIRGISPSYLFAEQLWYFTGRNDMRFISTFGSMWERLSDDGVTNNSAYGYLMKHAFGFDQIEKIIELLRKDPNSRRAVINLNTPNEHVIETHDEPCTICLQFLLRDGKLNCTTVMRSNDIWFGFPYDVAFFTELQMYIADRLEVEYGTYTHFVMSMHLYDRNEDEIIKMLRRPISNRIVFDRHKFHHEKTFVVGLIDHAINHCSKEYTRELMLDLAKEHFGFKEINDEDYQHGYRD